MGFDVPRQTDTAGGYVDVDKEFTRHEMIDHGASEYARGDAHSNTVEGYFSVHKRHRVSEAHLKRYFADFDFRYNQRAAFGINDPMRAKTALKGIVGKQLMYLRPDESSVG
jgi:hypothetical protein